MSKKTLTAGIAAAALVGTIGLAYAQTSNDPSTQPASPTQSMTPDAGTTQPSDAATGTSPTTSPSTPAAVDNTQPSGSERAPQADRN